MANQYIIMQYTLRWMGKLTETYALLFAYRICAVFFFFFFAIYIPMFDFKDILLNWLGVLYENQLF